MNTMEDRLVPTLDGDDEVRDIEARLRQLAEQLTERARVGDGDSLALLSLGVALQRTAFLLRSELAADVIDLRAAPSATETS